MKKSLQLAELEICETEDQSKTVLHKTLNAHYRSLHGALDESEWVFFKGCRLIEQEKWKVIELGFGLGTNLKTLVLKSLQEEKPLSYIGLDHQPIPLELVQQLYPKSSIMYDISTSLLSQIERGSPIATWSHNSINIQLWAQDIHQAQLPYQWANAFFHDPFGPTTNPNAWTSNVFKIIQSSLHPSGILSTYGAAGHARRAMVESGLWTASTKGFGRKREMTIASSDPSRLSHGTLIKKYVPKQTL